MRDFFNRKFRFKKSLFNSWSNQQKGVAMRNFVLALFFSVFFFTGCTTTPFVELSPGEKLELVYGDTPEISYNMDRSALLVQNNSLEVINNRFDSNPVITFSCESVGEEVIESKLVGGIVGGGIYHHKVEIPKNFQERKGVTMTVTTPISTTMNNDGSLTTTESVEIFNLSRALLNRE